MTSSDDHLLADLLAEGAVVDGDLVAVGERWAIHATVAYGGEILVSEYDSVEQACAALAAAPPNPPDPTGRGTPPTRPAPTTPEELAMSDTTSSTKAPVMFVHGLWLHATSWTPWIERFAAAGYDATAPRWPDEADTVDATRADPDAQAGHGIDDVVEHHAALIAALDQPPILIGHSFGGTIVERLLTSGLGVAGIAIDAAPIKGVLPVPISSLRSAFPVLKNPANTHRTVALTAEQFRYGFGNAIPQEESDQLWEQWTIPSPGRPIFQSATANLTPHSEAKVDTRNDDRGPAAAHRRRPGPHRPRSRHRLDPQAVQAHRRDHRARRSPRPRSLPRDRPRLDRRRRHLPRLAGRTGPLTSERSMAPLHPGTNGPQAAGRGFRGGAEGNRTPELIHAMPFPLL